MAAGTRFPNLDGITASATLEMSARASALEASGVDMVSLSAGEPDFPTPGYIVEAAVRAIREGETRYPPAAGLPALRSAIAAHLNEACGGAWDPGRILVSVGAKQALFDAIFTLFGPGDRVVVPAPCWVSYVPMVKLARAEPVIVETTADSRFKLPAERLREELEAGARGVVLNSPSNPTGAVYDADELDAIVAAAERHGAWVVADEIYREIRYEPGFASLAARADGYERIVVVDGFSKAYAMTGWRVGFAAAPEPAIGAMTRLQGHLNTNTARPSQHAALAALSDEEARRQAVGTMVSAFARRRELLFDAVEGIPGLVPLRPRGAFYLWVEAGDWCDALGAGSATLCLDLLENEHLALVPGSAFETEGHLRLSFAASDEELASAAERLEVAARRLGGGG
ncbi:MAG: pyridoxal phosphate-dependent aminotransferase [Gemmatimonadota bacterium]|nr:pyridoxal phosphate-dependent aminotransferase [Gemmatimonadota bacterium]